MTITNPTLVLTYTGSNTTATITSADIVTRSITIQKQLLKDLEPSSNTVSLTISRSCSEVEDIIASESDIKAVLKNNGTTVFTGYLSTDYNWTVTANGEQALAIKLEDVGTRLLEKEFISSGYHTFNCTVEAAVTAICTVAGITTASGIVYPVGNVIRGIEGATTCKDLLSSLLAEFNCVYYFNANGQMLIHEVNCTSTTGIPEFDKTKLFNVGGTGVKLNKKIRQYKNARVTYKTTDTASDYLIYRNTTKDTDSSSTCYLTLSAGQHFDGTEKYTPQAGVTRSPAYIEAVNATSEESLVGSREILVVTNASADVSGTSGMGATVSVAGGKYLQIDAKNEGNTTGYFSKLDVKGSIIYVKTDNVILTADQQVSTTQSNNILEEELVWVHTKAQAQKRANLLAQYHRYGGSTYTFYSSTSVALGSVVRLHEDAISGLDVNVMLIASKETDESDVIEYSAVGVSVFDLTANVTESKTGEGAGAGGQKGEKGDNGYSQATVTLYKRSSSTPSYDGGILVYTFSTGGVTGNLGTWSRSVPSGSNPLYVISASAFGNSTTDSIEVSDWTAPAILSENGTKGDDGYTVMTIILYQRGATAPTRPISTATYNFNTGTISGVGNWSLSPVTGTDPLWVTTATASTRLSISATDNIEPGEWTTVQKMVENGAKGDKGDTGETGPQGASGADAQLFDLILGSDTFKRNKRGSGNQYVLVTTQISGYTGSLTIVTNPSNLYADGQLTIPINNNFDTVTVTASYGSAEDQVKTLKVFDETEYNLFLGCNANDPSTAGSKGSLLSGDYHVKTNGQMRTYNGSAWVDLSVGGATGGQMLNALMALKNAGISLSSISSANSVTWLTTLIAENVFAEKVRANNAFFNGITLQNATFTDGDLVLSQIKTHAGTRGDSTGSTALPGYTKWNISEIYNAISTANSYLSASGSYSGSSVSQVLKLTNPDASSGSSMAGPTHTLSARGTTEVTTSGTITETGTLTGTIKGNMWQEYCRLLINGAVIATGTSMETSFSINVNAGDSYTFALKLKHQSGFTPSGSGTLTSTYTNVSFRAIGFTSTGLWVNIGSWQNLGTSGLFNSSTGFSVTINGTTYSKADHYALVNNMVSYNFNNLSYNRDYKITSSGLTYQGSSVTGKYYKKLSASSAILTLSDNRQISLATGGYEYLQGKIYISEVAGGIEMQGQYPSAHNTYDVGNSEAYWSDGYIYTVHGDAIGSSARVQKTDIAPFMGDALAMINDVDVVNFHFKRDKQKWEEGKIEWEDLIDHVGFIADDTDPTLSGKRQDSMITNNCIGVLIRAVQQLSAEIDKLKK